VIPPGGTEASCRYATEIVVACPSVAGGLLVAGASTRRGRTRWRTPDRAVLASVFPGACCVKVWRKEERPTFNREVRAAVHFFGCRHRMDPHPQ
jgi:hypothetical protein